MDYGFLRVPFLRVPANLAPVDRLALLLAVLLDDLLRVVAPEPGHVPAFGLDDVPANLTGFFPTLRPARLETLRASLLGPVEGGAPLLGNLRESLT